MATRTLGTNATTTLTAAPFPNATQAIPVQDLAAINALIKDDRPDLYPASGGTTAWLAAAQPFLPNALRPEGLLFIPNRGVLKVLYGDWIGIDASGWPVLLSARAIQAGATSWTHSGTVT